MAADPTLTPEISGGVAGLMAPAAINTGAAGTPILLGSLLVNCTDTPPVGAGVDSERFRVPVELRPTLAGAVTVMVPGGATVTLEVAWLVSGALTVITADPTAVPQTRNEMAVEFSPMDMLGGTVAMLVLLELTVNVIPPAGAGPERVSSRVPWLPAP